MFLPCKQGVIPPTGGWKPRTYYSVRVAWNKSNPVHMAIFYSGFLNDPDGGPGGYSQIWNPSYDREDWRQVYYMEVVEEFLPASMNDEN